MFCWNSRTLVLDNCTAVFESWKSHSYEDAGCSNLILTATSVPSDMHPAQLRIHLAENDPKTTSSADEVLQPGVATAERIAKVGGTQFKNVDTAFLWAITSSEHAEKSEPFHISATRTHRRSTLFQVLTRSRRCCTPCKRFLKCTCKSSGFLLN